MTKSTIRSISTILSAILICLSGLLSFSAGSVNFTFQGTMVIFVSSILGGLNGTGATGLFLIAGTLGLPIFPSHTGGIETLVGADAGYIAGYFIASVVTGLTAGTPLCFEKTFFSKNTLRVFIGILIGHLIIYSTNSIWQFIRSTKSIYKTLFDSFIVNVFPFIPFIIAGIFVSVTLAVIIRPRVASILYSN